MTMSKQDLSALVRRYKLTIIYSAIMSTVAFVVAVAK